MKRTLAEINREAYRLLADHLGPADYIRFIRQFNQGRGDWTKERQAWMASLKPGELIEKVLAMQAQLGGKTPATRTNGKAKPARPRRRPKVKA